MYLCCMDCLYMRSTRLLIYSASWLTARDEWVAPVQFLSTFFFLSHSSTCVSNEYATSAMHFSHIKWKSLVIFGTCLFFVLIFLLGTIERPHATVKELTNIEKYALSISPTHLSHSGECVEVAISTLESLPHDARVCWQFHAVVLLRWCYYLTSNPNSYCFYYCCVLF